MLAGLGSMLHRATAPRGRRLITPMPAWSSSTWATSGSLHSALQPCAPPCLETLHTMWHTAHCRSQGGRTPMHASIAPLLIHACTIKQRHRADAVLLPTCATPHATRHTHRRKGTCCKPSAPRCTQSHTGRHWKQTRPWSTSLTGTCYTLHTLTPTPKPQHQPYP